MSYLAHDVGHAAFAAFGPDVEHQLVVRKPCPADGLAERVGQGRIVSGATSAEVFLIEIGAVGEVVHL
jgi:hypothetical protein